MSTTRRSGPNIIALLMVLLFKTADATEGPHPPCDGPPVPAYSVASGSPTVQSQTVTGWTPPACLNWEGPTPTLLVSIAGRLHEAGGADALLARLGAVSRTYRCALLVGDGPGLANSDPQRCRGD